MTTKIVTFIAKSKFKTKLIMRKIESSELIINNDGSVFHLHLKPENIADIVILVGDPSRVEVVASYFDSVECKISNREFVTITGRYRDRRMTVISTGIGTDNIDIVVTELVALVNVDLSTRYEKECKKSLTLLRLGTSGGIQPDVELGAPLFSRTSIGFDGLLNFYKGRNNICELEMESEFMQFVDWNPLLAKPYFVNADESLYELFKESTVEGITISAPGFYAPQGRWVRLEPEDVNLNEKIQKFEYNGRKITNYEMESSALAGLAKLMGHKAATICVIIAQRVDKSVNTDYQLAVDQMIRMALDKLYLSSQD